MLNERFLQNRELAVLGKAFHRADRLAVEAHRRNDAGGAGVAGPVRIIDDDRAAKALRGAAAELGTGHPEILAQKLFIDNSSRPSLGPQARSLIVMDRIVTVI